MESCWANKAEERPSFDYLYTRMEQIHEQLTMVQDDSPSSTRLDQQLYSRENSQVSLNHPSHQSRRRRTGRNSFSKNSPSVTRRSINSRVSAAGSEHLSLTFSVLSGDLSSVSSCEGEEGPEILSPLAESVVYQMMPSLLKDDNEDERRYENEKRYVEHLPTSSPINLVTSFLDSNNDHNSIELEASKYAPIPSTFISPAPTTPSTVTTRLTPWETNSYTSSQFAPSTLRSDDSVSTQLAGSSPSPDLISKSSTFGEDLNSNPRFSYISQSNADTVSKTSISESVSALTPGPGMDNGHLQPSFNQSSNIHAQSNGQPSVNGASRTDEESEMNEVKNNGHERKSSDTKSPEKTFEKGQSNGDSARFSLGLNDLSSDLMATFDSWNS